MEVAASIALLVALTLGLAWALLSIGGLGAWRALLSPADLNQRVGLLCVFAALVVAAVLRFDVLPHHHAMYTDEPGYVEAARNLANSGVMQQCVADFDALHCVDYPKAHGWPVLLAAGWWLGFGSSYGALALSALLGVLAVLVVALAARRLLDSWWAGGLAALLLAVQPVHAAWSVTAETHSAAGLFLLLGLWGVIAYQPGAQRRSQALLLAAAALGLAVAMRPTMAAILPLVGLYIAWCHRRRPVAIGAAAFLLGVGLVLGLLSAAPMFGLNREIWGDDYLSFAHLQTSLDLWQNSPHGLQSTWPWITAATLGIAALGSRRRWAELCLLLGSAAVLAVAALAYENFQLRMLIEPLAIACVLGCGGLFWLAGIPLRSLPANYGDWRLLQGPVALACSLPLLLAAQPGLVAATHPPETQQLETRLPKLIAQQDLPADALILAEYPEVLRAEIDTEVMRTGSTQLAGDARGRGRLPEVLKQRPVYLLCDMYCEAGHPGADPIAGCKWVLGMLRFEPVVESELHGRVYGLYRIVGEGRGVPGSELRCPGR